MSLWPTQLSTKACKPSCLSSMKFLSKLSLNHRLGGRDKRMFGKLFLNCRHRKVKLYLYMQIPGYKNLKLYNLSTWQDLNGKDGRICFNDSTSYTLSTLISCLIVSYSYGQVTNKSITKIQKGRYWYLGNTSLSLSKVQL